MLAFFVARDGRAVRKLFHAMIEVAPHHPTLTDVSHILRETFDPNADAPDRFQDLLDKLATVPSNRSGA